MATIFEGDSCVCQTLTMVGCIRQQLGSHGGGSGGREKEIKRVGVEGLQRRVKKLGSCRRRNGCGREIRL